MDWGFIFTCLSLPTSIYGIYELIKKVIILSKKSKSKSIIWKNRDDWVIVLPQYFGKYRRVEDIIASEKIYTHCNNLGLNCIIQDDSQSIPIEKNLILICGPKSNKVTEKLYKNFKIEFKNKSGVFTLFDSLSNCNYKLKINQQAKKIENDYAILSRYIDPNTKRICIFCAGLNGLGTLGSANELISYGLTKYIKEYESFESILSVSAIDKYFSAGMVDFIIPPRKL